MILTVSNPETPTEQCDGCADVDDHMNGSRDTYKSTAVRLFEELQAEFPQLSMSIDANNSYVEVNVEVSRQPRLEFDVYLNLQNEDELHLSAGGFWCSWFPISNPKVVRNYRDAVVGIISGRYRILEYVRRGRVVGADLQAPDGSEWKTVAKSCSGILPVSWWATRRVLRNESFV